MKKQALIAFLSIFPFISSSAQHCPWDGSSFIMLEPPSSVKIKSIYLVDSTGSKVTSNWYSGSEIPRVDTARFFKNDEIDPKDNNLNQRVNHFVFAKDYYALWFGQYNSRKKYQVAVIYEKENRVHEALIPLSKQDVHVLCTSNRELWDGKIKPTQLKL